MQELDTCLDRGIGKCRAKASFLMARVSVANHLITNTLWYTLTVWAGKSSFLETLQKKLVRFMWAGPQATTRHRVRVVIITRPKGTSRVPWTHLHTPPGQGPCWLDLTMGNSRRRPASPAIIPSSYSLAICNTLAHKRLCLGSQSLQYSSEQRVCCLDQQSAGPGTSSSVTLNLASQTLRKAGVSYHCGSRTLFTVRYLSREFQLSRWATSTLLVFSAWKT